MDNFQRFELLTKFKGKQNKNKTINYLEGTLYLDNFYKINDFLILLENNKVDYMVVVGFKGKTNYPDKYNEFKYCILDLFNDTNINKLNSLNIDEDKYKIAIKQNKLKISIK